MEELNRKQLFKSIGLSEETAYETVKNAVLSSYLQTCIDAVTDGIKAKEIPGTKGKLLYHVACQIKPQIINHIPLLSRFVMEGKIDSELSLTAAIDHLISKPGENGIVDIEALQEALNDGLTVATQQFLIEQAATANSSRLQHKKFTVRKSCSPEGPPPAQSSNNVAPVKKSEVKASPEKRSSSTPAIELALPATLPATKRIRIQQTARKNCGGLDFSYEMQLAHIARIKEANGLESPFPVATIPQNVISDSAMKKTVSCSIDQTRSIVCSCSGACYCAPSTTKSTLGYFVVEPLPAKEVEVFTVHSDSD